MGKATEHEKELKALEREFKAWRRKRRRGTRIPETLWASAISAGKTHGLWKISKRLGLDYYALRKRSGTQATGADVVDLAAAASRGRNGAVAEFVELPLVVERAPECVLEFEDERGTLRVGLKGAGVQQLEAAARLLWELSR